MVHLHLPLDQDAEFENQPLPTRMLRQILVGRKVHLGGRVLVVGGGRGDFVAYLGNLGYCVEGVDEDEDAILNARQRFPLFDFHHGQLGVSAGMPVEDFDLILVQNVAIYQNSLLDLGARTATANLLAALKPDGDLVFIDKQDRNSEHGDGHQSSCWKRHLACFPGDFQLDNYPESFFDRASWDWLWGLRSHQNYFTVTFQLRSMKQGRAFWCDLARRGMMTDQGACCPNHAKPTGTIRRAA